VGFSKYKIEWALLILGLICASVSIVLDVNTAECTTWFARSGSIIVLVAAIVEYRLSSYLYGDIYQAAKKSAVRSAALPKVSQSSFINGIVKSNLTSKPEVPLPRRILSGASHALVVIGTIVWGYGDLWVC
jgi:hypothetical protein